MPSNQSRRGPNCIILAAGANTRLNGMVPAYMKPLVLVNGRPLIMHAYIHALDVWGADDIIVVASPDNVKMLAQVLPRSAGVQWVVQPDAVGVVDAIARGMRLVKSEKVLILCGDNQFEGPDNLRQLVLQEGAYFGSRKLEARDSLRFTRWRRRTTVRTIGVELLPAGPLAGDPGDGCWIGPLLLNSGSVQTALNGGIPSPEGIVDLIRYSTSDGENLEPIHMLCSDMGVPEALNPVKE